MKRDSYFVKEDRILPVFLLVDTSGSMRGEKIETVNIALKEMLNSFQKIKSPKGIINLCIVAFGNNGVEVIKPLSPIADNDSYTFFADGMTPMGEAFSVVSDMIEDYSVLSERAYYPSIILISDGNPTDFEDYKENMPIEKIMEWPELQKLLQGSRSSKSVRLAMGIGGDVDTTVLRAFINDSTIPVIKAYETDTISKFFDWVSMSISVRSVSINPNQVKIPEPEIFDKDEVDFGQ